MSHGRRGLWLLAAPVAIAAAIAVAIVATGSDRTQDPGVVDAADSSIVPDVAFVDVAGEVGINHVQQSLASPPDCLFEDAVAEVLPEGAWSQAMSYVDCYEERFTGGVAVGDADGDALDDLYVTRLDEPGILYINRGNGTFVDKTDESGLSAHRFHGNGAGFADIDNDGDQDLYITTVADPRFFLFVNDGTGTFSEEGVLRGAALEDDAPRSGFSVSFGDYDLDGYLDIHTTEWRAPLRQGDQPPEHARLLRNQGAERPGFFEDMTAEAGVALDRDPAWMPQFLRQPDRHANFSFSSSFVDLDGDRYPELVVGSDFTTSQLFWNDGDGTFTEGTREARVDTIRFAMGSTFGDYDADGDLDWFVTSIMNPDTSCAGRPCESPYNGNRLYRNDGDRVFADVTDQEGVRNGFWGWGTAFTDFDNDGRLDIVATNGQDFGDQDPQLVRFHDTPMRAWHNQGDSGFAEVSSEIGLVSNREGKGLALLDFDGDGDSDVYVANNGDRPALFRNEGNENHWLRVRAQGVDSNRDGYGAVVEVQIEPDGPIQRREIGASTHFLGQSERVAHVGLGDAERVARLTVTFPATGRTVTRTDVSADELLTIVEPDE